MTELQTQPKGAEPSALELVFDREFDAPVEQVFEAFTDPAQLRLWWGPKEMTVPVCELDVRVGGAWRTVMESPDGQQHIVGGTYTTLEPPHVLAFTWAWEYAGGPGHRTQITIRLQPVGERTAMRFEQRTFKEAEHRSNHEHGWVSTWASLEAYLAAR